MDAELSALCQHVSDCAICQAELDRISGDADMKQWRKAGDPSAQSIKKNQIFRAALDRASQLDTDVDSVHAHATRPVPSTDPLVVWNLQGNPSKGELGTLAGYRVVREIGRGGAAIVFEAIDTRLDRAVAIKLLRPEQYQSGAQERFLREAKALAQIRDPHVVAIHSISTTGDDTPLIAMELADGGCLQQRIASGNRIEPRQAAQWIAQVADGLAAVHQAGLIHRDIKPSNVLLMSDAGPQRGHASSHEEVAKLADFGLVRLVSGNKRETQTGQLLGTPAYMSPEHITNFDAVDARSDIYCLGATFYECLTSEPPFRGSLAAIINQIEHDDPAPPRKLNSDIPADLETICFKAMQRERGSRYATAQEFSADLKRWLAGEPIRARPVSNSEKLLRWCQRHPVTAGLVGTIASLLLLLAFGSTYAAISINAVQNKLRKEKENVEEANRVVRATADDLELQRQIALESLNSLVTKVQLELGARPGTLKLRETILQTALEGLEKVTKNAGAWSAAHTTIEAHIRKGEILELLGKTSDAISEFQAAATLAEQASELSQGSVDAQRDLGNALFMQAEIHRKAFAHELAQPIFERVLKIRKAIAEKLPDDSGAQMTMISTQQRLADIYYYRNEFEAAGTAYKQVLTAAESAVAKFPNNLILKRSLSIANERLGTLATTVGKAAEAQGYFEQVLKLNQELAAAEPQNGQYRADMAYITKRLASLASVRGDDDNAIRLAREAIERYTEIAEADPQDTDAQMKVGAGWDTLYEVELAAGHLEEAMTAVTTGLHIFEALAASFPTAGKYTSLAMEAYAKLGGVQFRAAQFAPCAESMERYLSTFEQYNRAADATPQLFASTLALAKVSRDALKLAMGGLDSIDKQAGVSSDMAYLAKTYVMYQLAHNGQVEQALNIGRIVKDYHAQDPSVVTLSLLALSRSYAVCLSKAAADSAEQSECLAALRAMQQATPGVFQFQTNDSDFEPILKQL